MTGVNDNAPVFTSLTTASAAENQADAYTAIAEDADNDTLTYSLSGTDAALFTINPATGVVSFITAPDFENPGDNGGDNVYDITVMASDGDNSTDQAVAITVTNTNDNDPVFNSGNSVSVAENQRVDSVVYTAMATDADSDPLTYSLSGTDAARFTIDPTTGAVRFIASPDFENPDDAGGNNVYNIIVTASDDTNNTNHDVTITVTNENDRAPVFNSGNSVSVAENQRVDSVVYTAMATDADGGDLTYSLSGTDAALFTIDPATGAVRFIASPDFENPGDAGSNNVYDITVTASDGDNSTNHAVAITVTDENENTPSLTSDAAVSVAENQAVDSVVYTAVATDADGDALTYSLSGTDGALFTIDPTSGAVRFRAAPDFENPGNMDGDNVYDIMVTASDGTLEMSRAVAITVTNINDNSPSFTSPATASVAENQTMAYAAVATDADAGDTVSYSLSGTDAGLFTINGNTGAVSFVAPPDFEMPGDDDGDNVYDIIVTASDGVTANDVDQAVAITVTNINDNGPVFTSPFAAIVLESQTLVYAAVATDADEDPLSYSLSGTDATLFMINPNTGVVNFIVPPDFENPGDADRDNVYNIIVTASDGINDTLQDVAITVTDVDDGTNVAPVFTSPTSADVAETQTLAYTAMATDADGDPLMYSLSGTDATLFTIDPTTGAVSFIAPPDFEMPGDANEDNDYHIIVTASDGDNSMNRNVTITVTNENDNDPSFTSPATASVAENQTDAYTAIAEDADNDALTYSLSGTDAALFTINPATGVVSFITAPDFENPGDNGGDNVYDITVMASDGDNSTDHAVAITVTNTNDNDPVFNSGNSVSVAENQRVDSVVYTAMATDADSDPLTYSLSGTDAARFTIDPTTGAVRFIASPDFENPGDAGGNNVYDITVTASDGGNSTDHAVAITVTDENENIRSTPGRRRRQ